MAPHFPWMKSKDGAKKDKDAPSPATTTTLLNDEDEQFLERLVSRSEKEGPRPALPPRSRTPDLDLIWDEETETFHSFDNLEDPFAKALVLADTTNNAGSSTPVDVPKDDTAPPPETDKDAAASKDDKKPSRLSRMFHREPKDKKSSPANLEVPTSPGTSTTTSPEKEWADLSRILDKLSLSSSTSPPSSDPSSTASAASSKSSKILPDSAREQLLLPFLQILKDFSAGVPTASNDLKNLITGQNDIISKSFSKLPSSLQKLVTQLPDKLTTKLAPEILALAAEAQGVDKDKIAKKGVKGLVPSSLSELALTPALIKSMLKTIVNALKTRWPAFAGASALWSVAVVLLLFVLWYCHKRGKEEREKREKEEQEAEGQEGGKEEVKGEEVVDAIVEADATKTEGGVKEGGEAPQGNELVVAVAVPPPQEAAPATAPAPQLLEEGKK
ncbi:hypothetical protein QBC43DRAFT_320257 [Cladorrhinum sp. PSN259]|nr:hypothetical protein QBC43DRAFT_320257 [Cladorrhinum sp. PSN259]